MFRIVFPSSARAINSCKYRQSFSTARSKTSHTGFTHSFYLLAYIPALVDSGSRQAQLCLSLLYRIFTLNTNDILTHAPLIKHTHTLYLFDLLNSSLPPVDFFFRQSRNGNPRSHAKRKKKTKKPHLPLTSVLSSSIRKNNRISLVIQRAFKIVLHNAQKGAKARKRWTPPPQAAADFGLDIVRALSLYTYTAPLVRIYTYTAYIGYTCIRPSAARACVIFSRVLLVPYSRSRRKLRGQHVLHRARNNIMTAGYGRLRCCRCMFMRCIFSSLFSLPAVHNEWFFFPSLFGREELAQTDWNWLQYGLRGRELIICLILHVVIVCTIVGILESDWYDFEAKRSRDTSNIVCE